MHSVHSGSNINQPDQHPVLRPKLLQLSDAAKESERKQNESIEGCSTQDSDRVWSDEEIAQLSN